MLSPSIYSLSVLCFLGASSGLSQQLAGTLHWRPFASSEPFQRSIRAATPLRAKKKAVDPERAAKRKAAMEARQVALKKAEAEKRNLEGLPPAPAAQPVATARQSAASAAKRAAPVARPAPAPRAQPGRRKRDPEREAKRLEAAKARQEAIRRAAEERQKLQVNGHKPAAVVTKRDSKRTREAAPADLDFGSMTVVELKEELRKRGLKVSGKKQELIERLQAQNGAVQDSGAPSAGEQGAAADYTKMKVAELREELKKLQQPTTGRKDELIQRLQAATSAERAQPQPQRPAVGQKLRGTVTGLRNFGAFVDIGLGRPALVRTSRLAERHVRAASEVVQEGEDVDVWVYRITADGLLGLSMIEYPTSRLQDPVSAFEGISSRKWFKGKVRYQGDRELFVDVTAPGGAVVQGKLAKAALPLKKVSDGQELDVRVVEVIGNTGTLRLSARA